MIGNLLDTVEVIERQLVGEDELGDPIYDDVAIATSGARVSLIDVTYAQATASAFTDVSVRLPYSVPAVAVGGKVRVLAGPLARTYTVRTVRPARDHRHYIVRA